MTGRHRELMALLVIAFLGPCALQAQERTPDSDLRVSRFLEQESVELFSAGHKSILHKGESLGAWTLLEVIGFGTKESPQLATLENFKERDGHVLFVSTQGVLLDLPKTLEPTFGDPGKLYCGHTLDEIVGSDRDLLADEILAKPGDPDAGQIAQCFPPIRKMKTYTFVGTHDTIDKLGFEYGGVSPDFDAAAYDPQIRKIREDGKVWDGLVGGWLPVVRFVYPEDDDSWAEMVSFAPLHTENGNQRIQPVWYRVAKVEKGSLKWVRYFDSYHPYPPHTEFDPKLFYQDLYALHKGWKQMLQPAMRIRVPDERLQNMTRHSLVRALMTRVGDFPKYGVFDKNYAGSEHDGFPDTFTVDTAAMLEWGMVETAGRYIDNYFGQFVRDDGSILYRGPETGEYGRMLTLVAQYANYGGDPKVLLRRRSRIDGVTELLLSFRAKALQRAKTDPAYGMIAGWSEADSCLDPDPTRYMQPYFSNSTEAARGFHDLGLVWERIGRDNKNPGVLAWGRRLVRESEDLRRDLRTALKRSTLKMNGETILPSIAGVQEPFHVAVARDPLDPQYRSYRAYMEMLYSGVLNQDQARQIVQYRASHHDTLLGIPTAYGYNTSELAGFLSYGQGYGLIQHDMIREAILLLDSLMAHQYTRGTWTAPETRNILPDRLVTPYCTPAQLVVPLIGRWLLVFEDSQSDTLWLGKGVPRAWLEDGKTTSVENAPTRWGRVGFSIISRLKNSSMKVNLALPSTPFGAKTILRLRVPEGRTIKSVRLNAKAWGQYDPHDETITIPRGYSGQIEILVMY